MCVHAALRGERPEMEDAHVSVDNIFKREMSDTFAVPLFSLYTIVQCYEK